MSPTGSKTGHPFLANGPRRSTRVGEPSRRPRVTLLLPALSNRGHQGNTAAEANLCADGVPQSLPLSLSEHLVVVSVVSNTELECPSEIPFIAGGCPDLRERFNHTNHLRRPFRTN